MSTASLCFIALIAVTLVITAWAAKRTASRDDLLVAGGRISAVQNGFAIAGDFMSAATFLGITALFYSSGFDAVIYILAPLVAFSLLLFLIVQPLRKLGRYTFGDVLCSRLEPRPVRVLSAVCTLATGLMYLMVQVVGAGALLRVLFGMPYPASVTLVAVLMMGYVALGGMLATTWVQIVKAVMLVLGAFALAIAVLAYFDFDVTALYERALSVESGGAQTSPGGLLTSPGGLHLTAFEALSLGFSMTLGIAGSPHILMRFLTVRDVSAARGSAFVALLITACVFILIFFIIAVGAVAVVTGNPRFHDASGALIGGGNMVVVHLTSVVGGELFLGIMSAIIFATILAVVAGLTLAGVAALAHDLYGQAIKRGRATERQEMVVSRLATVLIGVIVILLALAFEKQNIAYLASLALSLAASSTFPLLILAIYWRGLTTRGAVVGALAGLTAAVLLVVLGPAVWTDVLKLGAAPIATAYPGLYSIIIAFALMWGVSALDRSPRAALERTAPSA
jgi:cation/acetate symporter